MTNNVRASTALNYYHRPRLPNGQLAPLTWQICLFFLNVNWPISADARNWARFVARCGVIIGFCAFCFTNEAELRYMTEHINDIGLTLDGMGPWLVLVESQFRVFHMAWRSRQFQNLLDEFFLKIYIERDSHPKIYASIERALLPAKFVSYSYILTVLTYLATPIFGYIDGDRLLPFRMAFVYDYTQLPIYIPILLCSYWIGLAVGTHLIAEINTLAMMILHLNARYSLLQRHLTELYGTLKRSQCAEAVRPAFRRCLVDAFRRNVMLNEFAGQFQAEYSFRIFVMLAFSALLLCVLAFKAATVGVSTENIKYITWILGKIIELIVFGQLGSKLIETTGNMSSSYYNSNWEHIIDHGESEGKENIENMRIVALTIAMNRNGFCLSGLGYFKVSLVSVIRILQGAGSYFTFLYTYR